MSHSGASVSSQACRIAVIDCANRIVTYECATIVGLQDDGTQMHAIFGCGCGRVE